MKKRKRPKMKDLSKDRLIVESSPEFGEWAEPSALPLSSMSVDYHIPRS
jgi:hypothetical protein